MTALSVGSEIINLRRIAPQLGLDAELDAALAALAQGHSAAATARFAALDRRLAALAESGSQAFLALRARADGPSRLAMRSSSTARTSTQENAA